MDNLTHTLIGLGAGEIVWRKINQPKLRRKFWITSVIANNIPDLDFVLTPLVPGRLGSLLHHRGHTHTIAGGVIIGLLVGLLAVTTTKGSLRSKRSWGPLLVLTAILGCLLHVLADFGNSYGVHPFWPVSPNWFYGDSVFIVDPILWTLLAAPWIQSQSGLGRLPRFGTALIPLFGVGLLLFTGFVPWQVAIVVSLGIIWITLTLSSRLPFRPALSLGVLFAIGYALSLGALSSTASRRGNARVTQLFGQNDSRKVFVSPAPGNPLCWMLFTVEHDQATYHARRGVLTLLPSKIPAAECLPSDESLPKTRYNIEASRAGKLFDFNLQLMTSPSSPELLWDLEFQRSWDEYQQLLARSCEFRSFLRFSRIPLWKNENGVIAVADFRHMRRSRSMSFSTMKLKSESECPPFVPDWAPPLGKHLAF